VLGGNRFVGRRLVELLRERSTSVSVFHRSPAEDPKVNVVVGDRERSGDLARAFATNPSVVVDLSLYTGAQGRQIIPFVRERGCRYIVVSSAVVYSMQSKTPWLEDDPLEPAPIWGAYGRGKADADRVVREAALDGFLLLRPTYFIGSRDPARRCASLFARAAAGEELLVPGDGSAMIQVIDAEDMAKILMEAISTEISGVVNVAGSEPLSVKSFTQLCASLAMAKPRLRHVTDVTDDELDGERWPFPNASLHVADQQFSILFNHRCRTVDASVRGAFASWAETRDAATAT
jgi:nucleoside-diphosphate-sugar epimerase